MNYIHTITEILTEAVKDPATWQRLALVNGMQPKPDAILAEILRQSTNCPEHPDHTPPCKFQAGDRIKAISSPWDYAPFDIGGCGIIEEHQGYRQSGNHTDGSLRMEHWYYVQIGSGKGSLPERCMEAAPLLLRTPKIPCPACAGTGKAPAQGFHQPPCDTCNGTGAQA